MLARLLTLLLLGALPVISRAELTVMREPGEVAVATGSAADLGTVALGCSGSLRAYKLQNLDPTPLTDVAVAVIGDHAGDFQLITDTTSAELDWGGTTSFQVAFVPQMLGVRTATLSITSSDPNSPFQIALSGTAVAEGTAAIQIIQNPTSQILPLSGTLTLTASAQGNAGLKYQWKRNNANIVGATSPQLTIPNLKTTHAGAYKCQITSTVSGKVATATSLDAQIAIVDTAPKSLTVSAGVKTTLTTTAAGNSITYQWLSGSDVLPDRTDKTLVLGSPQITDSGGYSCRITAPGGSLLGSTTTLTVYNDAPEFLTSEGDALPPALVSGTYIHLVPVNPDSNRTPTAFSATGLPPGLAIHKTSGVISGKPTASKAIPYDVTLTASNARGKATVKVKLTVSPLPAHLVGTYTALLSRFIDLNSDLGGRLELVTTARGALTGKLILGSNVHPFTGALDTDLNNPLIASATIPVKRAGKPLLTLTLTLDAESNWISTGQITDGTAVLDFSGWRNVWSKTTPASAYAGYYTFGLGVPEAALADETVPQGHGYGSFTLTAATGQLRAVGKLADGTAYTIATFAGPAGEIGLFQTLYPATTRGSLLGTLFIGPADPVTDNSVYGSLSWSYPGTAVKNARTYPRGFGPLDLTALGSVYTAPTAPQVALGLTEGTTSNAALDFTGTFMDIPAPAPDISLIIGAKSKITLPSGAANPRKTTLTLTAATGAFGGGFTLSDADFLSPGKTVTRPVTYSGLIVRDPATGAQRGEGFFLLPNRPAEAGQTAGTTNILSGAVLLEAIE
ncbi:MAG TPA: immunoglobulin domain-containing protein [Prosthecobacter sp.]|nr:immunoglobulin domain-containing protein [Prosthecobacter sp.]